MADMDKNMKKKKVRFNAKLDICLLEVVLSENPFELGLVAWDKVSQLLQECGLVATAMCCKERTLLLLKQFREDDTENLKK
jgi:hypothetical protein